MKPNIIFYTPEFHALWKKVPSQIRRKAINKESIFRTNIFAPQLKTHKLKGVLAGHYSFSIDYHWRIVFSLVGKTVYFLSIGTHAVYR